MLRSQGIPARMVIGFKGGEWNPVGGYYQVQQLHAHAWVEAYVDGQDIPPRAFAGEEIPRAAWLVLDPTEGTQEGPNTRGTGVVARLRQSMDYARMLWINYVASLNPKRQRQGIYEPLAAGIEAGVANVTSLEIWRARLEALEGSRLGKFWSWYRRHWFSWRGGLVAIGFSLCAVGFVAATRAAVRACAGAAGWDAGSTTRTCPCWKCIAAWKPPCRAWAWCDRPRRRPTSLRWRPAANWPSASNCAAYRICRAALSTASTACASAAAPWTNRKPTR